MKCVSALLGLCLALTATQADELASPQPSDWSSCSEKCGGGNKTQEVRPTWIVPCNSESCDFKNANRTCSDNVDVIFLLDRSQSIQEENFWITKQVIADVITLAHSDRDVKHVGVISFDHTTENHVNLTDENTHRKFIHTVRTIPYAPMNDSSVLVRGIVDVYNMCLDQGRPGAEQVVVVITGGYFDESTELNLGHALMYLHDNRTVFSLAVPKDDLAVCSAIASSQEYFYNIDNLGGFVESLVSHLCPETEPEPQPIK